MLAKQHNKLCAHQRDASLTTPVEGMVSLMDASQLGQQQSQCMSPLFCETWVVYLIAEAGLHAGNN